MIDSKDEDTIYCILLFIIVGFFMYLICTKSKKVEQYINMDQFESVNPEEKLNESLATEKVNFPKRKPRDFPPSLTSEGEILDNSETQLADYKLLDELVSVQPGLQEVNHQLNQPSPDSFSSMFAPFDFKSKLLDSQGVDIDDVQGPPRKQVPESISGGAGGKKLNIIMIYAPWCGWSKKALPDFEKLYKNFNGKTINGTLVQIIKYNSEVDTDMVEKYEVEGFPTFIMEKITTQTTSEVINERSYEGLAEIINKNA